MIENTNETKIRLLVIENRTDILCKTICEKYRKKITMHRDGSKGLKIMVTKWK